MLGLHVRVDYYSNGEFYPISFIDKSGKTRYIRYIYKVIDYFVTLRRIEKVFFCETNDGTISLGFIDNKWYEKKI